MRSLNKEKNGLEVADMESLADMLKQMPGVLRKEAEEKVRTLLSDPKIRKLRSEHPELDEFTLKVNMNRLYQYVKETGNCEQCPGLDCCPNDLAGHCTHLQIEHSGGHTLIDEEKVACPKFLARQSQEAVRRRIRTFHIDESILRREHSFEDIVSVDYQRAKAVETITDYIEKTTEEGLQTKGLYLQGNFGTGKTFLMCYMLHQLARKGFTSAIVYMPDFAEDLKGMFNEPHTLKNTIEMIKNTDLLVFDDIGAENLNPWLRDHVIGAILNSRMNRKPTFFTSNYNLDSLEQHFSFTNKDGDEEYKGRRIMDRIRHYVQVVEVNGHNKRAQ